MKYNIISIDDSRQRYKDKIRQRVNLEEVFVPSVNGHNVDLDAELIERDLQVNYTLQPGEQGIWLSTFDCWQWVVDNDDPLVVFEDDAVPTKFFNDYFYPMIEELPSDWDFLSLWVPNNQVLDFLYDVEYDEDGHMTHVGPDRIAFTSIYNYGGMRTARAYQGYGNVAMVYSTKGAQRLIDLARKTGLNNPVDCYIFTQSHIGAVQGFAPKPNWTKVVAYDWLAQTTIHF